MKFLTFRIKIKNKQNMFTFHLSFLNMLLKSDKHNFLSTSVSIFIIILSDHSLITDSTMKLNIYVPVIQLMQNEYVKTNQTEYLVKLYPS